MNIEQLVINEFNKRGIDFNVVVKLSNLYCKEDMIEIISDLEVIATNNDSYKLIQNELINSKNKNEFKEILKQYNKYNECYNMIYNNFDKNEELKKNLHLGYQLITKYNN